MHTGHKIRLSLFSNINLLFSVGENCVTIEREILIIRKYLTTIAEILLYIVY